MSSLWLGPDHLVYVKGSGFFMALTEEYRRFRYSDIQVVSLAKTSRFGKGLLYLFSLLFCSAAVTLIFLLTESLNPAAVSALSVFFLGGLGFLALLLRHLVLGPTCICDIQTRLTRERLRPLKRYHRAVEAIRLISELVRENQDAGNAGVAAGEDFVRVSPAGERKADCFQIPRSAGATFGLFLIIGISALAALHLESLWFTALIILGLLSGSLLLTVTLVAVVRCATPDSVRTLLWLLLGIHFSVVGAGSVYFLITATREPAYTVGLAGPLEAFAGIATNGGLVGYGVFVILFLCFILVGLFGVIEDGKWRRHIQFAKSLETGGANEQ